MTDSSHTVQWETFVVRVWREPSSGTWRGSIVHLPDRAAIHVASFEQAEEFMRRYVPEAETGPPVDIVEKNESAEA